MAGPVLPRRALIVGMGAELRRVAEKRLELGGDRRVIGAGESGRGHRRRRRRGEKLNDEGKRDEQRGPGRAPLDRAPSPAPRSKRKCPAPEAHQTPSDRLNW